MSRRYDRTIFHCGEDFQFVPRHISSVAEGRHLAFIVPYFADVHVPQFFMKRSVVQICESGQIDVLPQRRDVFVTGVVQLHSRRKDNRSSERVIVNLSAISTTVDENETERFARM